MTDRRFTIMSYALFLVPMLVVFLLGCSKSQAAPVVDEMPYVGHRGQFSVFRDEKHKVSCYAHGAWFSCVADSPALDGGR